MIRLTLNDANELSRILGLSWDALERHGHTELLDMANGFAYRNIIAQRHAGDRIKLRSKYVAQWQEIMQS